jgi:LuxR family transcriptional regulator, maltose regulon positive regulatory protein
MAVELDKSLLDAKFSVPQLRPGSVSRAEWIETARTGGRRVVGVTAPAGNGKSTLLTQWARSEDRRVAWVSLDRYDDEPAILLALLASAYLRATPGNADLIDDMGGLGASVLGRSAPRLASVLRSSREPFVLMLDDLHALQSQACHDVLGVVIVGIPQAHSWSPPAARSSPTSRGGAPRVMRSSSRVPIWLSTSPAPSRSSPRFTSASLTSRRPQSPNAPKGGRPACTWHR